jgi:hypothetical protein
VDGGNRSTQRKPLTCRKNRIKVFENTETEKMEVDIIKPVKTKPLSKAFDMFEKKGIIIGQVLH